jgi:hypothetical protein
MTSELRRYYGQPIRISSPAGPCLQHYILERVNRATITVSYKGDPYAQRRYALPRAHGAPCRLCTDHPDTAYPHGYQD